MTAQELIDGLRERGYTIRRSTEVSWVIIPRVKADDPFCEWLGKRGANMRPFDQPGGREYEALLTGAMVTDEDPVQALWDAAAP